MKNGVSSDQGILHIDCERLIDGEKEGGQFCFTKERSFLLW